MRTAAGQPVWVVAHRGVHDVAHENTLAAFHAAVAAGADVVEFDVRRTADGVLILSHDAEIAGLPTVRSTFQALHAAAHRMGIDLARLDDLFTDLHGRIRLDCELKEPGYEAEVMAAVERHRWPAENVVYTSFADSTVARLKALGAESRAGLLVEGEPADADVLARAFTCGADFVAPEARLLTPELTEALASAGLPVWVWTVNDPVTMERVLGVAGVEAVITDSVGLVLAARG